MKLVHYREVEAEALQEAEGVRVRWVIGPKDRPPNFFMRVFEIAPGASTPYHNHPWEHEVFVLRGRGSLECEGKSHPIGEGDVVFLEASIDHCFRNTAQEPFEIICVIPKEGAR